MSGTVHVIGAGLAGLAAAVALTEAGRPVVLHEATDHGGGRCRSYHDPALGRLVDNGNHLILSGNPAVHSYLAAVGAADALTGPGRAVYPFVDVGSGARWTIAPNGGPLPWWVLIPGRRVPGSGAGDYLRAWRLAKAGSDDTVADMLAGTGTAYRALWEPLAVGVLNTAAAEGAAALLWPVLRETFGRGEAACRPRLARDGLGPGLVDPAVAWLSAQGARVALSHRLRAIADTAGRAGTLSFSTDSIDLGPTDAAILAVPPWVAADLLSDLTVPTEHRPIVNGHFHLSQPPAAGSPFLTGVVGSTAQWVFVRGDVASVTVSAAGDLADQPADAIAGLLWDDVTVALGLPGAPLPAHRIVKERRATFAQTPEQVRRRPGAPTRLANLFLAGDWTDTGLPATIEGAVRSGRTAAAAVLADA